MGSLIRPKAPVINQTVAPTPEETPQERAARVSAERDQIASTRDRAGLETERLFRLFGARNALGLRM